MTLTEKGTCENNKISVLPDDHETCRRKKEIGDVCRSNRRYDGVPIDGGWAWFVLAGGMLTMLVMVGGIQAAGILFLAFQRKFGTSSGMTSLVNTVKHGFFALIGTVTMTVGLKLATCRTIVAIGAALLFISFMATAFSSDFGLLILFQGVIQGIACSCLEGPAMSIVTRYFDKRRGLANSLTTAGASLGGLILPPLATFLLETYGYKGAMIILAAFNLHVFIAAAVFRPLGFYNRHQNQTETFLKYSLNPEPVSLKRKCFDIFELILASFDFKLFLNPVFVLFLIATGCLTAANFLNVLFTAPLGNDVGLSDRQMATLLTIFSVVDMCSRVIIGVLADLRFCQRSTLLGFYSFGLAITTHCARFYTSFGLLTVHVVIGGLTGGSVMALYVGIIVDFLTLEKLDPCLAFVILSKGVLESCLAYVCGIIRDETGSYIASYHLIGTLALIGGAIMFLLPTVYRWRENRHRLRQEQDKTDE